MSLSVFPGELVGIAFPRDKESSFANLAQAAPNGLEVTVMQTRNPIWKWTLIYELLRDDPSATSYLINGFTEYQTVQGFQLAMAANATPFLLRDPKDNAVGPAMVSGVPNPNAQLQLVTDGAGNWYSPIQRNFAGQFLEDITDLNGAIQVYANGTLKALSTDYTIIGPGLAIPGYSFMGLVIKWKLPSGLGTWTATHAYSLGAQILDPAGHIQQVTTAGTSGSLIPTFNDSGSTTTDGTVTWTDEGYNPAPVTPITAQFSFYFRVKFADDAQAFSRFDDVRWTIGGENAGDSTNMIIKSARPDGA